MTIRLTITALVLMLAAAMPVSPAAAGNPGCIMCEGEGWVDCKRCHRSGGIWCSCHTAARKRCTRCGATGHVRCPACDGATVPDGPPDNIKALPSVNPWVAAAKLKAELIIIEDGDLRLATDLATKPAHKLFMDLRRVRDYFKKIYTPKSDRGPWRRRCTVYVFRKRGTYRKFTLDVDGTAEMSHTGAYSKPAKSNPHIALCRENMSDDAVMRTMYHEFSHIFLDLNFDGVKVPVWLSEGAAQLYEFKHKPKGSRMRDCEHLVKNAFENGAGPRIQDVIARPLKPSDEVGYAVAWSLTSFLSKQKGFRRFVSDLKKGTPQEEAMKRAFGGSIARVQKLWARYVRAKYKTLPRR